ncbi:hypothetical protein ma716 [Moumouvirus australiensis]|uniref:DUF4419 domain-containing protein n=1 Tax=Moumouvirus australiensis TaxID=2109587 RepID=A0A2P1EMJ4_9VIRU|nr:hypothetical protein QKC55_gp188 [Moumouvirus australiensis]AVL95103.1 hypothetical protein ma716 [Moumouvirus australiensis]
MIRYYFEYPQTIKKNFPNSLIDMMYYAWTNHLGVSIRPDDLWIQILSQFALHVNMNNDHYKKYFTKSTEGKTIIKVKYSDTYTIETVPIDHFINKIVEQVSENLPNNELVNDLECNFTTSNNITKLVGKITLMYLVEKHYSYHMIFGCGIPYIDLEGTLEDWVNLQDKIKLIEDVADNSIKSWCEDLLNITNKIIETFNDLDSASKFWKKFFYEEICGSGSQTCAQGWITYLFIYDKSQKKLERYSNKTGEYGLKGIVFWDDFCECMTRVEFECFSDTVEKYHINSGIMGFIKDKNNTLKLNMGFYVYKQTYREWTFNDEDINSSQIVFSLDNYHKIKYNNKHLHELHRPKIPIKSRVDIGDQLEIYAHNSTFYYIYRSKSKKNFCYYSEGYFSKGKFIELNNALSIFEYGTGSRKNSIRIY